jgi:hypothetical protein
MPFLAVLLAIQCEGVETCAVYSLYSSVVVQALTTHTIVSKEISVCLQSVFVLSRH